MLNGLLILLLYVCKIIYSLATFVLVKEGGIKLTDVTTVA